MAVEDWRRVEQICQSALDLAPPDRPSFVAVACGEDERLRRNIDALLAQTGDADQFLEEPVGAVVAHVLGDPDTALLGRRIGIYAIESWLDAGGMGEIYRARDTELARDVAIKILPESAVAHEETLDRFEREARTLASLNHPNIATIYRIERLDGRLVLVLELIEGETLPEHIAALGTGLPIADALSLARQIAGALEAAHEKGIVHCDLKPANIKITPAGTVKVLDFGLATANIPPTFHVSQSLTSDAPRTHHDAVMGTPGDMSPEQVRGQHIDKRTDVWAFGCVVYEILTGRAAFCGETIAAYSAVMLERDPDWTALPGSTAAAAVRRRGWDSEPCAVLKTKN